MLTWVLLLVLLDSGAGQDHHPVLGVLGDLVEGLSEVGVDPVVPQQRPSPECRAISSTL
jgi:hypothetical protein